MTRIVLLGLLLGLLAAFPALAVLLGHLAFVVAVWAAGQPATYAFVAGLLARQRLARRPARSVR